MILLSLLFVTVCYAAPPAGADLQSVLQFETEMFSVQDETATVDVAVYNMQRIEAQEVAYSYIGNPELITGATNDLHENTATLRFAEMPVIYNSTKLTALNKPPSFVLSDVGVKMLVANKQHSNFGYPLTADRCRLGIVQA